MITTKRQPRRTCLGCGEKDDQNKLIRLVVDPQGVLLTDARGGGRGGYLHRAHECWQAFVRRKSSYRAFRKEISRDVKEQLIQRLNEGHGE